MILALLGCSEPAPKRVVMIFVDTQRPDHLGVYGSERNTSAPLDSWAAGGLVFEDARSVAPWTLPAARAVLSGNQPERWDPDEALQSRLGALGWSTALFAANPYLDRAFGMEVGWGTHQVAPRAAADAQVDRALEWLGRQEGDALLLVHLMDPHQPYRVRCEERFTRSKRPEGLTAKLAHFRGATEWTDAEKRWISDRYDDNIACAHDELGRLFSALGDATVVYFSDHGEELWEHGGYEHGHALHEELVRVPLILRGPGVAAGRVQGPVSLLDVAPTIYEILGLHVEGLDGRSLLASVDLERSIGLGRTLYGPARWAVVRGDLRYQVGEGREWLEDLGGGELPLEDPSAWRRTLGDALGLEVRPGYRLVYEHPGGDAVTTELVAEVSVPGGVAAAWVPELRRGAEGVAVEVDGEVVRVRWRRGANGEVFIAPSVTGAAATLRVDDRLGPRVELPDGRGVTLGIAVGPVPAGTAPTERVVDAETRRALEELGYVE